YGVVKGERHGSAAARRAVRRHVEQAVQPLHVLLDDLRHRIFDDLRRGSGVVGVDRHRGRRDRRVHGYRQLRYRQRAGYHDDDGNYPGENRPPDEELSHIDLTYCRSAAVASGDTAGAASAAADGASVASTGIPGWTFCTPSTMTRSPAIRPLLTSHL